MRYFLLEILTIVVTSVSTTFACGAAVAQGESKTVFTKPIIEETFCCRVNVYHDPCTNCLYIVPEQTTLSNLKTASV